MALARVYDLTEMGVMPVLGALAGRAGAAGGFLVAALLAALFARVTNASTREGTVGYLVIAVGILGAIAGTILGVFLFARSAPEGEGMKLAASAVFGLVGLVALAALAVWGWTSAREAPAQYGNTLATLELEFRVMRPDAPEGPPSGWLDVEVQTATTRPPGLVLSDGVREEGDWIVVPAIQNPLYRSSSRVVVARVADRHVEVFSPRWKAKPDPGADWSPWSTPRLAERTGTAAGDGETVRPILELRYRVRLYGD